jgi:hypothetical protein
MMATDCHYRCHCPFPPLAAPPVLCFTLSSDRSKLTAPTMDMAGPNKKLGA